MSEGFDRPRNPRPLVKGKLCVAFDSDEVLEEVLISMYNDAQTQIDRLVHGQKTLTAENRTLREKLRQHEFSQTIAKDVEAKLTEQLAALQKRIEWLEKSKPPSEEDIAELREMRAKITGDMEREERAMKHLAQEITRLKLRVEHLEDK